jgi:DNA-binding response OmpR family regulator
MEDPGRMAVLVRLTSISNVPEPLRALPLLVTGPPDALELLPPGRADDVIAEPWSPAELRLRLSRLVAPRGHETPDGTLVWSPTSLRAGEAEVSLSRQEFLILDALMRAPGECVPREVLSAVAGLPPGGRALDMQMSRLRVRLREVTRAWRSSPTLVAVRGSGYAVRM